MFFSTYFSCTVRSYMDITELGISTYTTSIIDSFLIINEEYQYTFIGTETSMSTCTHTSPHFFQAQFDPSDFDYKYKATFSFIRRLIVLGVYSCYTFPFLPQYLLGGVDFICKVFFGVNFIHSGMMLLQVDF